MKFFMRTLLPYFATGFWLGYAIKNHQAVWAAVLGFLLGFDVAFGIIGWFFRKYLL